MTSTLTTRVHRVWHAIESPSDALLGLRILGLAAFVRVAKYLVPLPRLVAVLTPAVGPGTRDREREARIATFAGWAARVVRPFDEGNCLERAVVAYRELARAQARPQLRIGFRRDGAALRGHAWVVVDREVVADSPAACAAYQVAMTFDAEPGRRDDAA